MKRIILNFYHSILKIILDEQYTYGGCIYFATALCRKKNSELLVYIYQQDKKLNIKSLKQFSKFKEIPSEIYNEIIIDHVYVKKENKFYDARGVFKKTEYISEKLALPFLVSEEELFKLSCLDKYFFEEMVQEASKDIDKYYQSLLV